MDSEDKPEREFDLKNSLENKSNSLITVSGIIIPLLFGFGTFLIEKSSINYPLIDVIKYMLISILVLNIMTIILSIWASKIRNYKYPFLHSKFFDDDCCIQDSVIKKYSDSDADQFSDMLIKEYLKCNKYNYGVNDKKAKYIRAGQIIFIVSLGVIPILIFLLFLYSPNLISSS